MNIDDLVRVKTAQLDDEAKSGILALEGKLQDAQNTLSTAEYGVDPTGGMMQAYGAPAGTAIKNAKIDLQQKYNDLVAKMDYETRKKEGFYLPPDILGRDGSLMIGAGEMYDRMLTGANLLALEGMADTVPAFAPYLYPTIEKERSRRKEESEIHDKWQSPERGVSRLVGQQLPFIAPQVGLGLARGGALLYSRAASTLGENGLKYPFMKGVPELTRAFPSTFASYMGRPTEALPAFISASDDLTPYIDDAYNAVKNNPFVTEAKDIYDAGAIKSAVTQIADPTRPGSNFFSRGLDSFANNVIGGQSIPGVMLREGLEGYALGGLDSDQTALNAGASGALTAGLLKAGAGFIAKPPIDPEIHAQINIKNAQKLGMNVSPGAYTGHPPTQQIESAMRNNSGIGDVIIRKLKENDDIATRHLTNVANPLAPTTKITTQWLDDTKGMIAKEKQNIVDSIGDSEFHKSITDGYLLNRNRILESVGGSEVEPRTGRVLQQEIAPDTGEVIQHLSDEEYVLSNGESIYDNANILPESKRFAKRFDSILSSGKLSGENYRQLDEQLALRLGRNDLPSSDRELLLNMKQAINEQVNLSLGADTAAKFKSIKAREAMTYKLYDRNFVDENGSIIPGAFSRESYYGNNWETLPEVTAITDAHNLVNSGKSANLSSNDFIGRVFGGNPISDNWYSLYGSRFINGLKKNPIGDFVAEQYYKTPSGIPEPMLDPFIGSLSKRVALRPTVDHEQELENYRDKYAIELDENGRPKTILSRALDEGKYQAQDIGIADRDLRYYREKTSRTFDKYKKQLEDWAKEYENK